MSSGPLVPRSNENGNGSHELKPVVAAEFLRPIGSCAL